MKDNIKKLFLLIFICTINLYGFSINHQFIELNENTLEKYTLNKNTLLFLSLHNTENKTIKIYKDEIEIKSSNITSSNYNEELDKLLFLDNISKNINIKVEVGPSSNFTPVNTYIFELDITNLQESFKRLKYTNLFYIETLNYEDLQELKLQVPNSVDIIALREILKIKEFSTPTLIQEVQKILNSLDKMNKLKDNMGNSNISNPLNLNDLKNLGISDPSNNLTNKVAIINEVIFNDDISDSYNLRVKNNIKKLQEITNSISDYHNTSLDEEDLISLGLNIGNAHIKAINDILKIRNITSLNDLKELIISLNKLNEAEQNNSSNLNLNDFNNLGIKKPDESDVSEFIDDINVFIQEDVINNINLEEVINKPKIIQDFVNFKVTINEGNQVTYEQANINIILSDEFFSMYNISNTNNIPKELINQILLDKGLNAQNNTQILISLLEKMNQAWGNEEIILSEENLNDLALKNGKNNIIDLDFKNDLNNLISRGEGTLNITNNINNFHSLINAYKDVIKGKASLNDFIKIGINLDSDLNFETINTLINNIDISNISELELAINALNNYNKSIGNNAYEITNSDLSHLGFDGNLTNEELVQVNTNLSNSDINNKNEIYYLVWQIKQIEFERLQKNITISNHGGNIEFKNGLDTYIEMTNTQANLNSESFTLEFWVKKRDNTCNNELIISKEFKLYENNACELNFKINGEVFSSNKTLDNNIWQHLSLSYKANDNSGEIKLFVNELQINLNASPLNNQRMDIFNNLKIGISGAFSFDEFKIWSKIKSNEDIINNYKKQINSNEASLFVYYDFNEGSGNTIFDKSNNTYHAKIKNSSFERINFLNKSLNFNSISSPIIVNNTNNKYTDLNAFTISSWFNLKDIPYNEKLRIFGNDDLYSLDLLNNTNNYLRFKLKTQEGADEILSEVTLNKDTWYYITISYNANTKIMRMYLNNTLLASKTVDIFTNTLNFISPSNNDFTIGSNNEGHLTNNGNFKLANLNIWKKRLSAKEINDTKNGLINIENNNLISFIPFIKESANKLKEYKNKEDINLSPASINVTWDENIPIVYGDTIKTTESFTSFHFIKRPLSIGEFTFFENSDLAQIIDNEKILYKNATKTESNMELYLQEISLNRLINIQVNPYDKKIKLFITNINLFPSNVDKIILEEENANELILATSIDSEINNITIYSSAIEYNKKYKLKFVTAYKNYYYNFSKKELSQDPGTNPIEFETSYNINESQSFIQINSSMFTSPILENANFQVKNKDIKTIGKIIVSNSLDVLVTSFSLDGIDKDLFKIDNEGNISLKNSVSFHKNSYNLLVQAFSQEGASSNIANVNISVTAITPILTNSNFEVKNINIKNIGTILVSNNDEITPTAFSLSGTDSELFKIDALGNISLKENYNFNKNTYSFYVQALSSEGTSNTITITINLATNDYSPSVDSVKNIYLKKNQSAFTLPIDINDLDDSTLNINIETSSDTNETLIQLQYDTLKTSDDNYSFTITPIANKIGKTKLTINVSDGLHSISEDFNIIVEDTNRFLRDEQLLTQNEYESENGINLLKGLKVYSFSNNEAFTDTPDLNLIDYSSYQILDEDSIEIIQYFDNAVEVKKLNQELRYYTQNNGNILIYEDKEKTKLLSEFKIIALTSYETQQIFNKTNNDYTLVSNDQAYKLVKKDFRSSYKTIERVKYQGKNYTNFDDFINDFKDTNKKGLIRSFDKYKVLNFSSSSYLNETIISTKQKNNNFANWNYITINNEQLLELPNLNGYEQNIAFVLKDGYINKVKLTKANTYISELLINKELKEHIYKDINKQPKMNLILENKWNYISIPSNLVLCDESIKNTLSTCNQEHTLNSVFSNSNIDYILRYTNNQWQYWDQNPSINSNYQLNKFIMVNQNDGLLIKVKGNNQISLNIPFYEEGINRDNFKKIYNSGWHLVSLSEKRTILDIKNLISKQNKSLETVLAYMKNSQGTYSWQVYSVEENDTIDSNLQRIQELSNMESFWIKIK